MTRSSRLIALALGALLLAAPAAGLCGASGPMAVGCPMAQAMDGAMCAGGDDASMDCCAAAPAREPLEAWSFEVPKPLTALLPAALPPAPTVEGPDPDPPPVEASRFSDRGRYTLFSSFLL